MKLSEKIQEALRQQQEINLSDPAVQKRLAAQWGYVPADAQPAQKAVAYLDLGAGGYMDIGTDLNDEQLASLPKGRHMLGIVGTYGVDGYVSAQHAPSDEYVGWYCAHCERGVDASEVTYHEQHEACGRVITDDRPPKSAPIIPEGWKLVPIEPTPTMITAALESSHAINAHRAEHCYRAMLAATPEAKP